MNAVSRGKNWKLNFQLVQNPSNWFHVGTHSRLSKGPTPNPTFVASLNHWGIVIKNWQDMILGGLVPISQHLRARTELEEGDLDAACS